MSMEPDFLTLTIGKQKNIALIAHDGKESRTDPVVQRQCRNFKEAFPLWNRNNGKNDYRPDGTAGKGL